MNIRKTRLLYESRFNARKNPRGRAEFVTTMRHWLGLCDEQGNDFRDHARNRTIRNPQLAPNEFSLQEMAQAIIGVDWQQYFDPNDKGSLSGYASWASLMEARNPGDRRALLEATGVGVDVSSFANINAWTGVVGGLIERKILDAFSNPMYIADQLMPVEPTKVAEGQKVIGASRIGDKAIERQPGEPHVREQFGERYVTLQKTRENALACDVNKEAVFFDLTGQVLEHAGQVGDWVAYRKEIDVVDCFIGATSTSTGKYKFTYRGTDYNTYSTSQTVGQNSVTLSNQLSNQLIDWTNVQTTWLQFMRMRDPETNTRILIKPNAVLVNPSNLATAKLIFGALSNERRSAGSSTQANAATLQIGMTNGSPTDYFGNFEVLWSPLVEQRCTDSDGLNLTQTNANIYWWMFEKGRAFRYMQAWPMTVLQAPANQYDMIDRGLVASYFCNERGMPSVWSPWHVVLNTN